MRKCHQKQLIELVETLESAHAEVIRLAEDKNSDGILSLMADCQECADAIGDFIEDLDGAESGPDCLREYSELLYKLSTDVDRAETSYFRPLKKQLVKLGNAIKCDLKPNGMEVVF